MIDYPNLIAGFLLGLVPTGLLWWADHAKHKRERRQEALDAWRGVAKEIELLLFAKDTTWKTIYTARSRHPIDTWRAILGPEHFRALEEVENAFTAMEHMPAPSQYFSFGDDHKPETEGDRQRRAIVEQKRDAVVAFSNMSRLMQDEAYQEVIGKEERDRVRANYWRHPLKTWRRERHNKRMRTSQGDSKP